MNKRKAIILRVGIFACIILTVLIIHYVTSNPISKPTKIIIYSYGTKIELTKDNPLFSKVVKGMNNRIRSTSSMAKLAIPENWESDIKNINELGVEFIYSKKQFFRTFPYTRLFFPIKGDYINFMVFSIKDEDHDGYYNGPIDLLPCSSKLTSLLKEFIK